jgi:hypothetical protein
MMTSALLHNGPDHLRPVEMRLRDWMDRHRYETIDQLRGQLSQRSVPDPAAFERANYIKTLASAPRPAAERRWRLGGSRPAPLPPRPSRCGALTRNGAYPPRTRR